MIAQKGDYLVFKGLKLHLIKVEVHRLDYISQNFHIQSGFKFKEDFIKKWNEIFQKSMPYDSDHLVIVNHFIRAIR
jgi:hypothetical protein